MTREEILAKVKSAVAENFNVGEDQVTEDTKFVENPGANPLDPVELLKSMEDDFELKIPEEEAERLVNVGSAVDYIASKLCR